MADHNSCKLHVLDGKRGEREDHVCWFTSALKVGKCGFTNPLRMC